MSNAKPCLLTASRPCYQLLLLLSSGSCLFVDAAAGFASSVSLLTEPQPFTLKT